MPRPRARPGGKAGDGVDKQVLEFGVRERRGRVEHHAARHRRQGGGARLVVLQTVCSSTATWLVAWVSWVCRFLSLPCCADDVGWADSWLICELIDATFCLAWLTS